MKILIIDDHEVFLKGIKSMISSITTYKPSFFEANNNAQAIEIIKNNCIDYIVYDLHLPDSDEYSVFDVIKQFMQDSKIIIISSENKPHFIKQLISLGVSAYIPKRLKSSEIIDALKTIFFVGEKYIPWDYLSDEERISDIHSIMLTPRQRDVYAYMMQGKSNKQIARHLHITERTVKNHLTLIYKQLNISDRKEALYKYGRHVINSTEH